MTGIDRGGPDAGPAARRDRERIADNHGTIDSQADGARRPSTAAVTNSGTFHAGSGATSRINGDYTQIGAAEPTVDLGDPASYGRLAVSGTAALTAS